VPILLNSASLDYALLETALEAARVAAALQRPLAGNFEPERWSEKAPSDFVTEVDRESEQLILARILARFPDHKILAEEGMIKERQVSANQTHDEIGRALGNDSPILWIIDPLDGTTNWLHGYPAYAVSIATLDTEGLRTAVVLNSANGDEFTAVRGHGATLNGKPIYVSDLSEIHLALIGTGFPFKKTELLPGYLEALGGMLKKTSGVRRAGAAALDLCDVACGRLDAFWEHWLMEWDVAAGALIVQEAGGTFGPLPEITDPTLSEAISGGKKISDAFSGSSDPLPAGGGAFLAGNGKLELELAEIWVEAVQTNL
jgi:myo-inositol-1(or 4)-monophosphatase